jgi:gliding motility-associated-like protein
VIRSAEGFVFSQPCQTSAESVNYMKRFLGLILCLVVSAHCFASHIAGGELFYSYVGPGANGTDRYKVTMRLFRDCASSGQALAGESVTIGAYNAGTKARVVSVPLTLQLPISTIQLNTGVIPCLLNPPVVCFQVGTFVGTVDLPKISEGYTLAWIRCCRSDNLSNLSAFTGVGATYITHIPGTTALPTGNNSSPEFLVKDTSLVCQNRSFQLDFGATDSDGDSLSYSFCDAYGGGTSSNPNPGPAAILSLSPLPYASPAFSGTLPLGSAVVINPATGKITGTAPPAGRYVINVCVTEWRNGKPFNEHRKDFILEIGSCDYAAADPRPIKGTAWCKDFSVNFSNNSSSAVLGYHWDFGVANVTNDTSNQPAPTFTYADTGIYVIKLTVTGSAGCTDSDSTIVGVYPGFTANIEAIGSCVYSPFNFFDRTVTRYGLGTTWRWDFGEATVTDDTSRLRNPSYQYPTPGTRRVQMIATSSKGCVDTAYHDLVVKDIPLLNLPFKDTLICSIDTLPLIATGTGNFSWTPNYNIIGRNTANPLVYPKKDTSYIVTLDENGCIKKDTVHVSVLDFITVDAGNDTSICKTDSIHLQPQSQALKFVWTPATGLSDPLIKDPIAKPDTTTRYRVVANLGKCPDTAYKTIYVTPYPQANAGFDTSICYGSRAQIQATIVGSSFTWSPTNSLVNFNTLSPIAGPTTTTSYVLTSFDTLGCPKPSRDTVTIKVIAPVKAFAGRDTSVVVNQPLQLFASGGTSYLWTPTTGMNDPTIYNPVVVLGSTIDSVTYRVRVSTPEGCFADDDIKVRVWKTAPDIFVPTGFTPNKDGKNDVLRPILVGMKSLLYFRVYNRWGQMVFSTSEIEKGWNGAVAGLDQSTGTFVYMTEGVDYLGNKIFRKGSVVLIR